MQRTPRAILLFALVLTWSPAFTTEPTGELIATQYEKLAQISRSHSSSNAAKQAMLEAAFQPLLPSFARVRDLPEEQLHALFTASDMLFTYSLSYGAKDARAHAARSEAVLSELQRRNAATEREVGSMLGTYLALWDEQKAKGLQASNKTTPTRLVPRIVGRDDLASSAPALVDVMSSGAEVAVRNFDWKEPAQIIVVSGCGISKRAATAIDSDARLRRAFQNGKALWLAPASKNNDVQEVREWNKRFPRQPIYIAYDNAAWKGVDFARIPTFYFYKEGRLVASHRGWSTNGETPKEILEAIAMLGL